jgi:hypothetical protein
MIVNPFLVTSVLFLFLAGLAALDSALTSFHLLPWFNGLRWLRVHLITLGALAEAMFGILPALISAGSSADKSRPRWDIWLALTLGILTLMVGIPLVNYVLIVTGGMLVFLAALLLVGALARPALAPRLIKNQVGLGRMFYLAGLLYLLLGIILGSGLWFGWGKALGIANPIEVHIHTNTWGFMSLVFAGLFVDLYPRWTGCNLARPDHIWPIFWLMTSGAMGSVLGPWLALNTITALGIVLHQAATVWLLSKPDKTSKRHNARPQARHLAPDHSIYLAAGRGIGGPFDFPPAPGYFHGWDRSDGPAGAHLWLDAPVRVCASTLPVEKGHHASGKRRTGRLVVQPGGCSRRRYFPGSQYFNSHSRRPTAWDSLPALVRFVPARRSPDVADPELRDGKPGVNLAMIGARFRGEAHSHVWNFVLKSLKVLLKPVLKIAWWPPFHLIGYEEETGCIAPNTEGQ